LIAVILVVVINIAAGDIFGTGGSEESTEAATAASETATAQPAADTNADTTEAATEAADEGPTLAERLAEASPERGQRVFRRCQTCHTAEKGAGNRVGPNLYGIVGADIARHADFNYSSALSEAEGNWTPEKLDAFITNPANAVPGNRMPFAGLGDAGERADVIAYLNSQSDAPLDLSAGGESGDESGE